MVDRGACGYTSKVAIAVQSNTLCTTKEQSQTQSPQVWGYLIGKVQNQTKSHVMACIYRFKPLLHIGYHWIKWQQMEEFGMNLGVGVGLLSPECNGEKAREMHHDFRMAWTWTYTFVCVTAYELHAHTQTYYIENTCIYTLHCISFTDVLVREKNVGAVQSNYTILDWLSSTWPTFRRQVFTSLLTTWGGCFSCNVW